MMMMMMMFCDVIKMYNW